MHRVCGCDHFCPNLPSSLGSPHCLLRKEIEIASRRLSARNGIILILRVGIQAKLQAVAGELPKLPNNRDWKAIDYGLVTTSPKYATAQARTRQARGLPQFSVLCEQNFSQRQKAERNDFGEFLDRGFRRSSMVLSILHEYLA